MTNFTATIRHNSIRSARTIDCGDNLAAAKKLADAEFSDEQRDYTITIFGQRPNTSPEIYSERKVSSKKWADRS
jgi:hypothetical protein